jgi:hypothetical protein
MRPELGARSRTSKPTTRVVVGVEVSKAIGAATNLSSSIDNLRCVLLTLKLNGAREGVLDSWVVRLDEASLYELNSQRGLSYCAEVY